MTDWRLKIYAYLHDPPDKPLGLRGHAAWGRELARRLVANQPGEEELNRWEVLITRADHLASGADRSGVLPRMPPSLHELRHPLSGQPIDISWVRPDPDAAAVGLKMSSARWQG